MGAAYVRWPDGHRAVLSWRPGIWPADEHRGPLAVAVALRATGYPAPGTELVVQLNHGVALVQELLSGVPPRHFTEPLLDQALTLNQRHAGALAGRHAIPWDGAGRGDRRFDLVTLRFGLRPDNSRDPALTV